MTPSDGKSKAQGQGQCCLQLLISPLQIIQDILLRLRFALDIRDSSDRVFVGGLPHNCSDAEIKKLLESYGGPIRHLDLPWSNQHMTNKGYCFVVFEHADKTDTFIQTLDGLSISGKRKLTVRRATPNGTLPQLSQEIIKKPKDDKPAVIITAVCILYTCVICSGIPCLLVNLQEY